MDRVKDQFLFSALYLLLLSRECCQCHPADSSLRQSSAGATLHPAMLRVRGTDFYSRM